MRHKDFDVGKRALQIALKGYYRFYRKQSEVRADLEASKNPIVRELHSIVKECSTHVASEYHRRSFLELAEFCLWIYAHDGAYKAQGDWCLQKLLEAAPRILPHIEKRDPKTWHINQYASRHEICSFDGHPLPGDEDMEGTNFEDAVALQAAANKLTEDI